MLAALTGRTACLSICLLFFCLPLRRRVGGGVVVVCAGAGSGRPRMAGSPGCQPGLMRWAARLPPRLVGCDVVKACLLPRGPGHIMGCPRKPLFGCSMWLYQLCASIAGRRLQPAVWVCVGVEPLAVPGPPPAPPRLPRLAQQHPGATQSALVPS